MSRIIADFCNNHLGDRRIMEAMIKAASSAGVDIAKFQSFRADKLRKDWPDYENAYQYYKRHELSENDHLWLMEKCHENGIEPLFTVFDKETVFFLSGLGIKKVKIASPDANQWDIIENCIDAFDEIIISTGMHTEKEIFDLRQFLRRRNAINKTFLLYCVSKYPTLYSDIDFNRMLLFDGFSDHTADITTSKKAIEKGVVYLERHYTLGKDLPGNDHKISSTPEEFKELVEYRNYIKKVELYKGRWNN